MAHAIDRTKYDMTFLNERCDFVKAFLLPTVVMVEVGIEVIGDNAQMFDRA